jgi:DHA1 family multidrug resistance protein-like MFS transporter
MNAGEQGLIFLSVSIGCGIGLAIYLSYLYFYFHPWLEAHDGGAPEDRLKIGLFVTILQPVGLFIFAWTAFNSPEFHWAIPTLGVVLFISGGIVVFQIIFVYVPMIYPQFAASLFAANDFARSAMGAGAIHVARPLFAHMGIGRGVSLLGGLMVGGVLGMMTLYHKGAYLRARSRFAMAP